MRLSGWLAYRAAALSAVIGLGGCHDPAPNDPMVDSAPPGPLTDAALDRSSSETGTDGGGAIDGDREASSPGDAGPPADHSSSDALAPGDSSTGGGGADGDGGAFDAIVPSDSGPRFDSASIDGRTSDGDATSLDSGTSDGDAMSLDSGTSDGDATSLDSSTPMDVAAPRAGVRLVAPLSTATVTSRRPILRWALDSGVEGAHVEVCSDRQCTNVVTSFDVTGSSGAPTVDLSAGFFFWRAYARRGTTTSTISTPVWQFSVGVRSAPINSSWGTVSDVDGDGWFDAIIGGQSVEIDVFPGIGRNGTTMHTTLTPRGAGDAPVTSIATAGDVNGDGYADLILGARGVPNARGGQPTPGRAMVYAGSATGLSSPPTYLSATLIMDLGFGVSVTGAGDINGDGYADVIIEGDLVLYVYLGGAAGLDRNPTTLDTSVFNYAPEVRSAGDINGDGYGDVIVGAPSPGTGRIYVYLGSAAGLSSPVIINGPGAQNSGFGAFLGCAGDVNADGYADFVVSEQMPGVDSAYLYFGSASGLSSTPTILSQAGVTTGAGDLNGDGYADIVIADPAKTIEIGVAYVFFGSANGPSSTPIVFEGYPTPNFSDGFGSSLVRGGDVDGDGYGDILLGSPNFNLHTGRATILFGSSSMAPPGRRMLIDQDKRMSFGVFIAGG